MPFFGRWIVPALLAIGSFGITSGCSDGRPTRVPVSGEVLIDGKPLGYGHVQFVPNNGERPSGGQLDKNGRFTLGCFERDDGAVLGTHRVTVQGGEYRNDAETFWHAPKKYGDALSSGLTQEIKAPIDSVKVELSWDGKKPYLESRPEEKWRPGREPKN
jgi:hypothetical protein